MESIKREAPVMCSITSVSFS